MGPPPTQTSTSLTAVDTRDERGRDRARRSRAAHKAASQNKLHPVESRCEPRSPFAIGIEARSTKARAHTRYRARPKPNRTANGNANVGPTVVIFNIIYACYRTNKHDSAPFKISKTHALHCRVHHLNISPPAGPRWWHTPRSHRGQSPTRSQRETSARAAAPRVGITTRAARSRSQRCARLARAPRTGPRAQKSAPC